MAAPTKAANALKTLDNTEPSTHGPLQETSQSHLNFRSSASIGKLRRDATCLGLSIRVIYIMENKDVFP